MRTPAAAPALPTPLPTPMPGALRARACWRARNASLPTYRTHLLKIIEGFMLNVQDTTTMCKTKGFEAANLFFV